MAKTNPWDAVKAKFDVREQRYLQGANTKTVHEIVAQARALAEKRRGPPKCYECRWFLDDGNCLHPRNSDLVVRGALRPSPAALRSFDEDEMWVCGFAGRWFEAKEA